MKFLIFILFFIALFFSPPNEGGWAFRQLACLGVICVVIAGVLTKKYHLAVGLCFLVTALQIYPTLYNLSLAFEAMSCIATLFLFTCLAICLEEKYWKFIPGLLATAAFGDAVVMIYRGAPHIGEFLGFMRGWWILTNASLDASFIALTVPIIMAGSLIKPLKIGVIVTILVAVLISKSNTAIVSLISMGLTFLVLEKKWKHLIACFLIALFTLPLLHFLLKDKFLEDFGRLHNWKLMMSHWWTDFTPMAHALGLGPGTYWVYAQQVQAHKIGDPVFQFMHNDFLQCLFEQGYAGALSVLVLISAMLYRARKSSIVFSQIIGWLCVAFTMYPVHLFVFQLLGVSLIHQTFKREKCEKYLA